MDMPAMWSYFLACLVTSVSPGPVVFLVIGAVAYGGVRTAFRTMLGSQCGVGLLAMIASLGVGAMMNVDRNVVAAMQILGAAYLAYLACRGIAGKVKRVVPGSTGGLAVNGVDPGEHPRQRRSAGFLRGFVVSATNPVYLAFFSTILPYFMRAGDFSLARVLMLGGTFILVETCILVVYIKLAGLLTRRTAMRNLIDRTANYVLLAMATFGGVYIAVDLA